MDSLVIGLDKKMTAFADRGRRVEETGGHLGLAVLGTRFQTEQFLAIFSLHAIKYAKKS